MKKLAILFFVLIISSYNLIARTVNLGDDFISAGEKPFLKSNLKYTGIALGVTGLLFLTDYEIKNFAQAHQSEFITGFIKYPKLWGDGKFILVAGTAVLMSGLISDDRKITSLGVYIYEGFLISGLYVTFVKFIFGRARPYTDDNQYTFNPFSSKTAYTSFYSGHTTEAFAFSAIISSYFKNKIISIISYSIAALTGIERIYSNKHWSSDVFLGAVTGLIIGETIIDDNTDFNFRWENDSIKIGLFAKSF